MNPELNPDGTPKVVPPVDPKATPPANSVEDNLKIALKEEREARKAEKEKLSAMEAQLAEIDAAKQKEKDKELVKKGEYDLLLQQKEVELDALKKELLETKPYKEQVMQLEEQTVTELIEQIDPAKKDFVLKAVDGKSLIEKKDMLKEFITLFKKPDFGWAPKTWTTVAPTITDAREAELKAAEANWFDSYMKTVLTQKQ